MSHAKYIILFVMLLPTLLTGSTLLTGCWQSGDHVDNSAFCNAPLPAPNLAWEHCARLTGNTFTRHLANGGEPDELRYHYRCPAIISNICAMSTVPPPGTRGFHCVPCDVNPWMGAEGCGTAPPNEMLAVDGGAAAFYFPIQPSPYRTAAEQQALCENWHQHLQDQAVHGI
jgi:hypothetical protein